MLSNSRDDQDRFGNRTLRQYIFDEDPDNYVTRFQIANQTTQAKLFAGVFAAFKHLTETNLKFIFPVGTVISIIPESIKLYRFIGRKNKSAKSWFRNIIDVGCTVLEIAGVTVFVAALIASIAWMAPLLFLINASAKFLWSLSSMTYYFGQMCRNWYHHEGYTQKHRADTANFIQSVKETLLSGAFLGFVLVVFFIPAAFPAVALGAGLVYGIELAASVIFGAFGLWGTGQLIKQIVKPTVPEDPAAKVAEDQKLNAIYSQEDKFNTLESHQDDLLIKLKLYRTLAEKEHFLQALLTEEKGHLLGKTGERFSDKRTATDKLEGILNGTETTHPNVRSLIAHFEKTGQIKNIFTSYFRPTGRLQKLFFLIHEYEKEKARLQPAGGTTDSSQSVVDTTDIVVDESPEIADHVGDRGTEHTHHQDDTADTIPESPHQPDPEGTEKQHGHTMMPQSDTTTRQEGLNERQMTMIMAPSQPSLSPTDELANSGHHAPQDTARMTTPPTKESPVTTTNQKNAIGPDGPVHLGGPSIKKIYTDKDTSTLFRLHSPIAPQPWIPHDFSRTAATPAA